MESFVIITTAVIGLLLIILNLVFYKRIKYLEKVFLKDDNTEGNAKAQTKVLDREVKRLDKDIQDLYEVNSGISRISRRGLCKVGFEKYDAFGEKGGKKSFSLALLDFKDNGVVMSNLQGNDNSRLYVRSVKNGGGDGAELSPEEEKALEKAKQLVFK